MSSSHCGPTDLISKNVTLEASWGITPEITMLDDAHRFFSFWHGISQGHVKNQHARAQRPHPGTIYCFSFYCACLVLPARGFLTRFAQVCYCCFSFGVLSCLSTLLIRGPLAPVVAFLGGIFSPFFG